MVQSKAKPRQPINSAIEPQPGFRADEQADELPENDEGTADDLNALMASLAGSSSSKVTVYRVVRGQPNAYVFATTPDAFSLDVLRDKYNGGEFRLFISRDGRLWKNRVVYVEPRASAPMNEEPTQSAALASIIREGFERQSAMMAQALKAIATPSPPPPSLLSNIDIPAAITAISALLTTLRPPAPPAVQSTGLAPDKAVDLVLRGFELAREMQSTGGGEGDSGVMGLMKEFIKSPILAQAAAAVAAPPPPRPQVSHAKPQHALPPQHAQAPQTVPAAPSSRPTINPQAHIGETQVSESTKAYDDGVAFIRQYIGVLVHQAAAGSDPTLYAELILDNADDETLQTVLQQQPSPLEWLASIEPAVMMHREWFTRLISTVAEAFADDTTQIESPQSIDQRASNVSEHATPSVPGNTA